MNEKIRGWLIANRFLMLVGFIVFVTGLIAIQVNLRFWSFDTVGSDTYYSWVEGDRILHGKNPYERILHGNMDNNLKYSTYFPLFYEASALVQYMGWDYYPAWIGLWRYFFLASNIATGLILWRYIFSKETWALSLLALPFWYFNRWTLNASYTVALDFIPIFFMVLSLVLFNKYRRASYLLYGFSLAVKQIAIFLAPLYLLWEYQQSRSIKKVIIAGLWIISIPLVSSIPFLMWSADGFIKSIAFSATRTAQNHFSADSIDSILGLEGLLARIPFLIMLGWAYFTAWQSSIGRYGVAMLVMGIFIAFNSILFTHYPVWLMPFFPLVASEFVNSHKVLAE